MNGKLLGLVRETLVRCYGDRIWGTVADGSSHGEPETDAPSDALICWLAREAVPGLSRTYPSLFARHPDLESFVRGLGDELPAVRVYAAEGDVPSFGFHAAPDGSLLVRIEGRALICALVQGVIAGAAVRYDEGVTMQELKCRKRGDNACVLCLRFHGAGAGSDMEPGREGLRAAGNG
ncbi:MAG: hypothetical protein ACRELC_05175 [Gemmatimonadota bacterium]